MKLSIDEKPLFKQESLISEEESRSIPVGDENLKELFYADTAIIGRTKIKEEIEILEQRFKIISLELNAIGKSLDIMSTYIKLIK